jgi:hypothetical protein
MEFHDAVAATNVTQRRIGIGILFLAEEVR